MNSSPCLNCKDRNIGCHSDCEKYTDFRKSVDRAKENKRKYEINRSALFCSKYFK